MLMTRGALTTYSIAKYFAIIPAALVATSASGLDPDISLACAEYQINRMAKVRHLGVKC